MRAHSAAGNGFFPALKTQDHITYAMPDGATLHAKNYTALADLLMLLVQEGAVTSQESRLQLREKFNLLRISQHPNNIRQSEIIIADLIAELYQDGVLTDGGLYHIASNLLELGNTHFLKSDRKLLQDVQLLEKIITERRILRQNDFTAALEYIRHFKTKYKVTRVDRIFRAIIGWNAGWNTASSFYGVITALWSTVPAIFISLAASVVMCLGVANYFTASYADEDQEFKAQLDNYSSTLSALARKDSHLRIKCYKLLLRKFNLLKKADYAHINLIHDKKKIFRLLNSVEPAHMIAALDKFIDEKLDLYIIPVTNTATRPETIVSNKNSIYTRVFHSKYWGPMLNFISAAGTSFGWVKTILTLAGVVALMGSPLMLYGIVAGITVIISALFAYKHLRFNLQAEEKKQRLAEFKAQQIESLEIKSEQMQKFKQELDADLIYMNTLSKQIHATQSVNSLTLSDSVASVTHNASSRSLSTSRSALFTRDSSGYDATDSPDTMRYLANVLT
jgi:hypothetical protein